MTAPKIGVQLHPQATATDELRTAWRAADAMGVDSIWVWDEAGADHLIVMLGSPFDLDPVGRFLEAARE